MRLHLSTIALALLASPALASSIEPVTSGDSEGQGSIHTITCGECPALREKPKGQAYFVPDIDPGTQKVEIREIGGEKKMFRSEAWLGGSPVVFVSKAPEAGVGATAMPTSETANVIDPDATTGALGAKAASHAVTASAGGEPSGSPALDSSTFELRVE